MIVACLAVTARKVAPVHPVRLAARKDAMGRLGRLVHQVARACLDAMVKMVEWACPALKAHLARQAVVVCLGRLAWKELPASKAIVVCLAATARRVKLASADFPVSAVLRASLARLVYPVNRYLAIVAMMAFLAFLVQRATRASPVKGGRAVCLATRSMACLDCLAPLA